jgi:hypothetical protein
VFFLLAAALTSLGTFSPAAVALLAPAAIGFAYESRIHPVLMGAFIMAKVPPSMPTLTRPAPAVPMASKSSLSC